MATEPSDSDIFEAASSGTPEPAPAGETTPPAVEQPGTVEQPAQTPMVAQPTPVTAEEPTAINDQGHRVPISELLDQREKRQAAERRAEELERRLQDIERRNQPQRQQAPDVLERPEDFAGYVRSEAERLASARIVNMSFADVEDANPEGFRKAWQGLQERVRSGDQRLADEIRNAPNPGRALMRWHQREETLRQIGDGGLDGYRQRALDEAMKDPAFRAKAMEAWRAEAATAAQPQPGSRSQTPSIPSLNRTTGAPMATVGPLSDAELFEKASARR